jgi:hypothetical protein
VGERKSPAGAEIFLHIVCPAPRCLQTFTYIHTRTHTHAHAHAHRDTHVHTQTHTHNQTHTHTHTHHAHARTQTNKHTHTQTHTHKHTHTQTPQLLFCTPQRGLATSSWAAIEAGGGTGGGADYLVCHGTNLGHVELCLCWLFESAAFYIIVG